MIRIEWDARKDRINQRKHGLSFRDAAALFASGARCLDRFDELHADREPRFIAIGEISRGLVVVVYTERDDDVVRIISARWATPAERRRYQEHAKDET